MLATRVDPTASINVARPGMTTELEEALESLTITQNGATNGKGKSQGPNLDEIQGLSRDVSLVLDQLYQIQELRHRKTRSPRLQELLSQVNSLVPTLTSRLEAIHAENSLRLEAKVMLDDLHRDLEDVMSQHAALLVEIKDDELLSRFEGTAQQATGMVDPLESSLTQCLHYVELVASSPVPVPFVSDLPELPSIKQLQTLVDRHEQMKKAYSPSISRILKMLEKSITDRSTQNGIMLRRFDEVSRRWIDLQRRILQLEARVKMVLEQQNGQSEVLASPGEYFTPSRPSTSHRSSVSSGSTSSKPLPKPSPNLGVSTLAPTPGLKRRTSFMSATSSSTARTVERVPSATAQTPANKRVTSVTRPNMASPTPSSSSTIPKSRIPVSSPTSRLSVPSSRHSMGSQEVLQTPTRPTMGTYSSMTAPRASLAPSFPRSMTAPRPRGPPSSFRTLTPTPSGRPSSRMSMVSYAPSSVAPANLQPFQPSKFDYLDMTVQKIIEETGFNLFVARVDQAMKRGQRRGEGEEWKGEFVFGAGQRTSSVKLLKLAGKASSEGPRMKCLVRVQGAWQDLATMLRKRQAEAPETLHSP